MFHLMPSFAEASTCTEWTCCLNHVVWWTEQGFTSITWATLCSPRGRSSWRTATRWTRADGSISSTILHNILYYNELNLIYRYDYVHSIRVCTLVRKRRRTRDRRVHPPLVAQSLALREELLFRCSCEEADRPHRKGSPVLQLGSTEKFLCILIAMFLK